MREDLATALADLQEEAAVRIVRERLDGGENPLSILADARRGMETVGRRFASCEYFLPDLVYSGEILKQVSEMVRPRISQGLKTERLGKVVMGTVEGDIHDIGKDIVTFMLDVNGFEVFDIGVDAPPDKFVDKIRETGATVVGMSGLLTLAFDSMKATVDAIAEAGLRDQVRIMIGGPQVDEQVRKYAGADAYGQDAMAGVALARQWTGVQ
ncbi:MAG: cobalamin B12-binding domain-containing protein [Chloroflexi bacterium]|nr:cobalamin B12-binding domain-containing protein [Chloroflexota bacterium]